MRHLLLLTFMVLASASLAAQTPSVVVLSATTDASGDTNDPSLRQELQEVIDRALESTVYGSLGCRFRLETTKSQQISGMAKRTIARYTFSLTYVDYVLDLPVGAPIQGNITGSGANAEEAVDNALTKLRKSYLSPAKLQQVVEEHRNQLPDCERLITRLDALRTQGQATGVLAVAQQLRGAGDCTTALNALVGEVYEQQQAADCRQLIIRAKAEVVAGNLTRAARLLAGVDPTLACADEVESLLDELMKRETIRARITWYHTAYESRTLSPAVRRRIISNLVLEYAYQNH